MEVFYGDWNVRAAAVAGKIKHITHYCLRSVERVTTKVRELQAQGNNVTQWVLLLNMDGFNLINQACPTCTSKVFNFSHWEIACQIDIKMMTMINVKFVLLCNYKVYQCIWDI